MYSPAGARAPSCHDDGSAHFLPRVKSARDVYHLVAHVVEKSRGITRARARRAMNDDGLRARNLAHALEQARVRDVVSARYKTAFGELGTAPHIEKERAVGDVLFHFVGFDLRDGGGLSARRVLAKNIGRDVALHLVESDVEQIGDGLAQARLFDQKHDR